MSVAFNALRRMMPRRLKIVHKVAILCVALALPFAFFYSSWLGQKSEARAMARKEVLGLQYLRPLRDLVGYAHEHESMAVRLLKGESIPSAVYTSLTARVDQALENLNESRVHDAAIGFSSEAFDEHVKTFKSKWATLRAELPNYSMEECVTAHTALLAQLDSMVRHITEASQLTQDSDPNVRTLLASLSVLSGVQQVTPAKRESTWNEALEDCERSLQLRIGAMGRSRFFALAGVIGCSFLATILAWWLVRSVTRQVDAITELFQQLAMGDIDARGRIISHDELGRLAEDLNDSFLPFIRREERGSVQQSLQMLLEETSAIENGDLSRRVTVTGPLTGAVADSFNYLTEELCNLITEVRKESEQTKASFKRIQVKLAEVARANDGRSQHSRHAAEALEEMAAATQSVAAGSADATSAADQARIHAAASKNAAGLAMEGLSKLRNQMRDSAKSIVRLQEGLRRILTQQEALDEASEQTNILAWNAAIRAAHLDDVDHPFCEFAEEAQRASECTGAAARKIAELLKTVQSEAQDTVANTAGNAQELLAGFQQVNQAVEALAQFESTAKQLIDHVQALGSGVDQQAQAGESMDQALLALSQADESVARAASDAARSIGAVDAGLEKLRVAMSRYRLQTDTSESSTTEADQDSPRMAARSDGRRSSALDPDMLSVELALQR